MVMSDDIELIIKNCHISFGKNYKNVFIFQRDINILLENIKIYPIINVFLAAHYYNKKIYSTCEYYLFQIISLTIKEGYLFVANYYDKIKHDNIKAKKWYLNAISGNNSVNACDRLVEILVKEKDFDQLFQIADNFIEKNMNDSSKIIKICKNIVKKFKHENISIFKKYMKKGIEFNSIYCLQEAIKYYEYKKYSKYGKYLKQLFDLDNLYKSEYINYLISMNDYNQIIKIDKYNDKLLDYYLNSENYDECIKIIERNLDTIKKKNDNYYSQYCNLGIVYIAMGKISDGISIFNEIIDENSVYGYLSINNIFKYNRNQISEEIISKLKYKNRLENLNKAIELFPENELVIEELAIYYYDIDDYPMSEFYFKMNLQINNYINFFGVFFCILYNQNKYDEALKNLQIKLLENNYISGLNHKYFTKIKNYQINMEFMQNNYMNGLICLLKHNDIKKNNYSILRTINSKLYDFCDFECPICFNKASIRINFTCLNHYVCVDCFENMINNDKYDCCFCRFDLLESSRIIN